MGQDISATTPITELLREINEFDGAVFPPLDECRERGHVLGKCPEELRRFFSFSQFCERSMKELGIEVQYSFDKEELYAQIHQLHKKYEVAWALLWFAVRLHFSAWDPRYAVYMAKDWDVVEYERQQDIPPAIQQFFMGR